MPFSGGKTSFFLIKNPQKNETKNKKNNKKKGGFRAK